MKLTIVTADLVGSLAERVSQLIAQHDRWSHGSLPPHITIIPPGPTRLEWPEKTRILALPVNLSISFNAWGRFDEEENHVVFLRPDPEQLERAQGMVIHEVRRLERALRPRSYFHATIARRIPDADLNVVPEIMQLPIPDDTCFISRLSIYEREDWKSPWMPVIRENV